MKRMDFEIEICAGNLMSVTEAAKGGADRVELCENLHEGGTTPSIGTIKTAKEICNIDVYVLIRPRGGNFVYTDTEMAVMLHDIEQAVEFGADGIVLGSLRADGSVNTEQCQRLIEKAKGLPITFHRAFDVVSEPLKSLEVLKGMGVQRILTSGQANVAAEGSDMLRKLNEAAGQDLRIMAASGVSETNVRQLAADTGVRSFHASMRTLISSSISYSYQKIRFNSINSIPENCLKVSNSTKIKELITKLEEL